MRKLIVFSIIFSMICSSAFANTNEAEKKLSEEKLSETTLEQCMSPEELEAIISIHSKHEKLLAEYKKLKIEYERYTLDSKRIIEKLKEKEKRLNAILSIPLQNEVVKKPSWKLKDGKLEGSDKVIIEQSIPDPEGNGNLLHYNTVIDLHTDLDYTPYKESFWQKNKFKAGVVSGVVLTILTAFAIGSVK